MLKLLNDASPEIYSSPWPLNPEAAWNFLPGKRGGICWRGLRDTWVPGCSPQSVRCCSREGRAINPWNAESQAADSVGNPQLWPRAGSPGWQCPCCPQPPHPAGRGSRRKIQAKSKFWDRTAGSARSALQQPILCRIPGSKVGEALRGQSWSWCGLFYLA